MRNYPAKVGDLLKYGSTIYRVVGVNEYGRVDVRRAYVFSGKNPVKSDGELIPDITVTAFDRRFFISAKVI